MESADGAAAPTPAAASDRNRLQPSRHAILTYHSIDRSDSVIAVRPEVFRAHVAALVAQGIPILSLADLLAAPPETPAVAITFDDGLESVGREAAPVLAEYGVPATLFVVTESVGTTNAWKGGPDRGIPTQRLLGWDELGGLLEHGWAIGSHTRSHPRLTRCEASRVSDELEGSAETIQQRLGLRPDCFAYPYGDLNAGVAEAARRSYRLSYTTVHLPITHTPARDRVPRLDAWYFRNDRSLAGWGTTRWRNRIVWRHRLRRARRLFK